MRTTDTVCWGQVAHAAALLLFPTSAQHMALNVCISHSADQLDGACVADNKMQARCSTAQVADITTQQASQQQSRGTLLLDHSFVTLQHRDYAEEEWIT